MRRVRAVSAPSVRCAANARAATRLAASLGAEDGRRHASVPCGIAASGGASTLGRHRRKARRRRGAAQRGSRALSERREARHALGALELWDHHHDFLPDERHRRHGTAGAPRRVHDTPRRRQVLCSPPFAPIPAAPPRRNACRRSAGSRPGPPKRPRPPHPPCTPAGGGAACMRCSHAPRARASPNSAHCPSAAFMAEQTSMPTCAAAFS